MYPEKDRLDGQWIDDDSIIVETGIVNVSPTETIIGVRRMMAFASKISERTDPIIAFAQMAQKQGSDGNWKISRPVKCAKKISGIPRMMATVPS